LVNNVKDLGVISDNRMVWRLHMERTVVKPLGTFRSKLFSTNIKLILYKALMVQAWEFEADTHLMKLQRLQNRVRRAVGYLLRRTPVRELHVASKLHYVYDYITKLSRKQIIQDHLSPNVRRIGQGEDMRRKYNRLNLAAVSPTTVQVSNRRLGMDTYVKA
jgi:hypothetical protein